MASDELVDVLVKRIGVLEAQVRVMEQHRRETEDAMRELERGMRDLEAENIMLRDAMVQSVRRLQEVVTWNEYDVAAQR